MDFFRKLTKRVNIDSDNWIEIQQLTFGDAKKTFSRVMTMQQGDNIMIDPGAVQIEQMCLSILQWGGPGFGGRPVTKENILALPQFIGDMVAEAIAEINEPMSEPEKNE